MSEIFRKTIIFLLAALALTVGSGEALAGAQKLGDVITNTRTSTSNIPLVLSFLAYCTGCLFCVIAIFKFKDHVDNPSQTPISAGLKRFFAGGMFLSLPFMARVMQGTIMRDNTSVAFGSGALGNPAVDPNALDGMVVNLMSDIAVPMEMMFSAFAYIMATAFLLVGINRLTKRLDDGPRGPAGMGTIMTFITSGVLYSYGSVLGAFTNTLFGGNAACGVANCASTIVLVDPNNNLGLSNTDSARIGQVIHGVMLFIALIGMIAFIRGWLVLRAFADGQQGATLAQGLTFLFGGALAVNLGDLVNALQASLGVNGISFK